LRVVLRLLEQLVERLALLLLVLPGAVEHVAEPLALLLLRRQQLVQVRRVLAFGGDHGAGLARAHVELDLLAATGAPEQVGVFRHGSSVVGAPSTARTLSSRARPLRVEPPAATPWTQPERP